MGVACQCINCSMWPQAREYYAANTNIIIQEIEKLITQNQKYHWNDERVGGLELALEIIYKEQERRRE